MIQQGPDPEWRLAFQDRLDDNARARIRRAVKNGQGFDDPGQAPIAVGLARENSAGSISSDSSCFRSSS